MDGILKVLDLIVPHIYGEHQKCNPAWCKYSENPDGYKMKSLPKKKPLENQALRIDLERLIEQYKENAKKLTCLGSSQANESFNNTVASKAPKTRAYGGSASIVHRVAASVLQKNLGHGWMLPLNEEANLSPGKFTVLLGKRKDRKRKLQKSHEISRKYKRRRLELKSAHVNKAYVSSVREGETYESGVDLQSKAPDTEEIPPPVTIDGTEPIVFFDLETTGLGRDADIVQIAAVSASRTFSTYILPSQRMTIEASRITKIEVRGSKMFRDGLEVPHMNLKDALQNFLDFISRCDGPPLVMGHNIARFDVPVLHNSMLKVGLRMESTVKGFVDTLTLTGKLYKRKKDVTDFKQATLVTELLGQSYDAHNALGDVEALQKLYVEKLGKTSVTTVQECLFHYLSHEYLKSFKLLIDKKVLSQGSASKMSKSGLSLSHLKLAYSRGGDQGVRSLLKENVAGKARVTSSAKILDKISIYFGNE